MMSIRRICSAFWLRQKRRDSFERHAVQVIHGDIKSRIDQTVAIIALLFEAITFTFCNLPNCVFALHFFAAALVNRAESAAPFRGSFNRIRGCLCMSMSALLTRRPFLSSAEASFNQHHCAYRDSL